MREIQGHYYAELLKQFENASTALQEKKDIEVKEEGSNQVAQETAAALLSGFGVKF
ncbi:hypothetical protein [Oceanobacillus oncorhynchi]|uniref:hypothetical protein n=1 Tax=Oceanobacillus oncorhynchi TaxID=545501 RepID=UPI001865F7BC|nr:hypothetical protein [Oceanobacillus oncorhynchi]